MQRESEKRPVDQPGRFFLYFFIHLWIVFATLFGYDRMVMHIVSIGHTECKVPTLGEVHR
jgi:hypothetical protein